MTLEEKVNLFLEKFLLLRSDLFLISCKISPTNKIEVIIDGDSNVSIQDCLDCSRVIESNLDREEEDFELSVYSSGISSPLQIPRQYKKNIGREINLITIEDKELTGIIDRVDEEGIYLVWKERRPKEKGKGKETVELEEFISYKNIKKAIISLKFK